MPQYLSPGVYVEEIDAGPRPIEGVSTSVCGAVGVTATGPTSGKPRLITSFNDFTRIFGGYLATPDTATVNTWSSADRGAWWQFPLAVQAYFENGGQTLFVKRVFSSHAAASAARFGHGLTAAIVQDTDAGTATVRLAHVIGVKPGDPIRIFSGTSGALGTPFAVGTVNDATGTVTVTPAIPTALSIRRGDFAELKPVVAPPAGPATPTLTVEAKEKGKAGDQIRVRFDPMIGNSYNILADPVLAPAAAKVATVSLNSALPPVSTITLAALNGLAVGDHVLIGGAEYVISAVTPGTAATPPTPAIPPAAAIPGTPATPATITLGTATPTVRVGDTVTQARVANNPAAAVHDTLALWGASTLYRGALVELNNGATKEIVNVVSVAGNAVTFAPPPAQSYFEGHRARVIEARVAVSFTPQGGTPVDEVFTNLRLTDDGGPNFLTTQVNQRSTLANLIIGTFVAGLNLADFPVAETGGWMTMAGGDDAIGGLSVDDFVGVDGGSGNRTGIAAFEDIDDISICIAPGIWSPTVHSALIEHCEMMRSRFAIIDPPDGLGIEQVLDFRAPIDTKYAALYYPWLVGRDPLAGKDVRIAPSAHMAGIYARVDNARGVHKAPANEVILGISKIAEDITKREDDQLNPSNVNALRLFRDRGNRVWGARCLTSDSSWKYINVRRLFIYVERSIDVGTQWVVFEPNDEPLWARVRQTITNFLTTTWRSGALQGSKPDEAFFVRCDRSTMTQDDIDNGRLICLIGIAPVFPAEFVIFRIQQKVDQTTP
jgi:phage tail sheath protein FI